MSDPFNAGAGTGVVETTTTPAAVAMAGAAIGDLMICQILKDGAGTPPSITGESQIVPLGKRVEGGATSEYYFAADPGTALHHSLYIGIATGTTPSLTFTGDGTDWYGRMYAFQNYFLGSHFRAVVENMDDTASLLYTVNGGTTAAISPPSLETYGADRLACAFVAVNDDNAVGAFTGSTGGTWTEVATEFASATGTDGCLQLQIAPIPTAGTISGGSFTMAAADEWSVICIALQPTDIQAPPPELIMPHELVF